MNSESASGCCNVDGHNENPGSFVRSKTAEEIIENAGRAGPALEIAPIVRITSQKKTRAVWHFENLCNF